MDKTPIPDLSKARILVTNDDGIDAYGIGVLEKVARQFSDDVWVCAPQTEQSGAGHSLTISRPLRLRKRDERHFVVDGTPTDSVLLAVNRVMADNPPDLVLSGINRGGNLAEDVTYSGTVSAAMEATLLGIPAIAMSLDIGPNGPIHWETAEAWAPKALAHVTKAAWPGNTLININFPGVPADEVTGMQVVRHGKRKIGDDIYERTDPRGRSYFWIGTLRGREELVEGTDIHVIANKGIPITPLHLDLTDYPTLDILKKVLG